MCVCVCVCVCVWGVWDGKVCNEGAVSEVEISISVYQWLCEELQRCDVNRCNLGSIR